MSFQDSTDIQTFLTLRNMCVKIIGFWDVSDELNNFGFQDAFFER